jgi:hypothetical protein
MTTTTVVAVVAACQCRAVQVLVVLHFHQRRASTMDQWPSRARIFGRPVTSAGRWTPPPAVSDTHGRFKIDPRGVSARFPRSAFAVHVDAATLHAGYEGWVSVRGPGRVSMRIVRARTGLLRGSSPFPDAGTGSNPERAHHDDLERVVVGYHAVSHRCKAVTKTGDTETKATKSVDELR